MFSFFLNPPFQRAQYGNWFILTLSISLIQPNCSVDSLTSKVNTCAVCNPSIPICWSHSKVHSDFCATMLWRSSWHWNSSVFNPFIHSAALLQRVIQINTEPFRNSEVETRTTAVEMSNGLRTPLVLVQIIPKWSSVSSYVPFIDENMICTIIVLTNLMKFLF